MRILHLADVHLDRPFVRADLRQGTRDRARLRETFSSCLEPARKGEVEAVTIGGDLWEDEHVSPDTRRFVAGELGRLACPALLICGNHDPFLPGGNYERTDWPDNVHVFGSSTLEERSLADDICVWGISWRGGSLDPTFLRAGAAPDDGRTHLLLVHGTATPLAAVHDDPSYCPFEPARINEAGFAYCLAGHIHGGRQTPELVYPGSPEPLGWGEMGRHCVALVTVTGGAVETELLGINQHRYEERMVDCDGCGHGGEVAERLTAALTEEDAEVVHLRVVLGGEVESECVIQVEELTRQAGERYAELVVVDMTRPGYDLESLRTQPTAKGYFIRQVQQRMEAATDDAERRQLDLALSAGLRALDRREDIIDVD